MLKDLETKNWNFRECVCEGDGKVVCVLGRVCGCGRVMECVGGCGSVYDALRKDVCVCVCVRVVGSVMVCQCMCVCM